MAQGPLPATIYVPVVFYDYHADGTNPNFEPATFTDDATQAGLRVGMVQNGLSADRKPRLLANLAFNDSIEYWFRPSGGTGAVFQENAGAGRWEWTNLVSYSGRADEFTGASFAASQPMANVVIYERLPFTLVSAASGTYELRDDTFFPLDNRGFGGEPASYPRYSWTNTADNNFGMAMELHHRFTHRNGLTFHFTGDDDVWVFIDGRLVMDLGGIHGALTDSVILDTDMSGLVVGQSYSLDFFYCDRHVTQSHIWIQTNLVAPITVDSLHIEVQPAVARIPAGDSVVYTVTVYLDSAGIKVQKPAYNQLVQWDVSGDAHNPGMSDNQGATSTFYGHRAWVTYTVTATLQDPVTGQLYTKTMTVTVDPGPPTHVVIEPDSIPDKWTPEAVDRLTMPVGVDRDSVYAVLRDRHENLVSLGTAVSWNSMNTIIAQVAATAEPYEGQVSRGLVVGSVDSTRIIASQGALLPDTARVVILNVAGVHPAVRVTATRSGGVVREYRMDGRLSPAAEVSRAGGVRVRVNHAGAVWLAVVTEPSGAIAGGRSGRR